MPRTSPKPSRPSTARPASIAAAREREAPVGPSDARLWWKSPWPIVAGFAIAEAILVAALFPSWRIDTDMAHARAYARESKPEKAIPLYEGLRDRFPRSPTINLELGNAYFSTEQWQKARDALQITLRETGIKTPKELARIGRCNQLLGKENEAIPLFQEAIRLDPNQPVAGFYLGERAYKEGRWIEAARLLEKAAFHAELGAQAKVYLKDIEKKIFGEDAEAATTASAPAPAGT